MRTEFHKTSVVRARSCTVMKMQGDPFERSHWSALTQKSATEGVVRRFRLQNIIIVTCHL
jgi:hypothetical protein